MEMKYSNMYYTYDFWLPMNNRKVNFKKQGNKLAKVVTQQLSKL